MSNTTRNHIITANYFIWPVIRIILKTCTTSWTAWVNSSSCEINNLTDSNLYGKGFQYQTRCCRNTENEADGFDTCHDEYNIIECTPKERLLELSGWSAWTACRGYDTSTLSLIHI